jgi:hypothetical protein
MPLFFPPQRIGPFGLGMGVTSRLLHERFGFDFGERFHRDAVYRVEAVMEMDRAVWGGFSRLGLGFADPFPRATLEPFGHRFVPVLYGCPCVYSAAEEPAVLPRALDPDEMRRLPPWTPERFTAQEPVREVLAQARAVRARFGDDAPAIAASRMGYNPHFRPLSCVQNLGSVINTAVSTYGEQVLCLYQDDPALLDELYRNVSQLMTTSLRELSAADQHALDHVFVGNCTVAMISPASYRASNLSHDRELAGYARSVGAEFLVHQDSDANPHLENYASIGYVHALDFGQDTDFGKAAGLFPGAAASCIIFPGWLHTAEDAEIAETLTRIMRAGLAFPDFSFSLFELDPGLAEGKIFEFYDIFKRCANDVGAGRTR